MELEDTGLSSPELRKRPRILLGRSMMPLARELKSKKSTRRSLLTEKRNVYTPSKKSVTELRRTAVMINKSTKMIFARGMRRLSESYTLATMILRLTSTPRKTLTSSMEQSMRMRSMPSFLATRPSMTMSLTKKTTRLRRTRSRMERKSTLPLLYSSQLPPTSTLTPLLLNSCKTTSQ